MEIGKFTASTDLAILDSTTDKELAKEIKKRHPLWPEAVVRKQIDDYRSQGFCDWYRNLLEQVNDD